MFSTSVSADFAPEGDSKEWYNRFQPGHEDKNSEKPLVDNNNIYHDGEGMEFFFEPNWSPVGGKTML